MCRVAQTVRLPRRRGVDVHVGERVLVPFGKRRVVGVVLEVADALRRSPTDRLKSVTRVLRDGAAARAEDLRLLRFAADYYHYPLGQVVMNALPQRLRRAAPRAARETRATKSPKRDCARTADDLPPRAARQAQSARRASRRSECSLRKRLDGDRADARAPP